MKNNSKYCIGFILSKKILISVLLLLFFVSGASATVQVVASDTVQAEDTTTHLDIISVTQTINNIPENSTGTYKLSCTVDATASTVNGIVTCTFKKNGVTIGTNSTTSVTDIELTYIYSGLLNNTDTLTYDFSATDWCCSYAGDAKDFRLMYDYGYTPAVHGYINYLNGTGINGATVLVAGYNTTTDSTGYYYINQSSLFCSGGSLCGYPIAAGITGYDANASFSNGGNDSNINITLTASGAVNTNIFFNDSQKMFDYFTPDFNTTGHIYTSEFDLGHFYYAEGEYADIGAMMFNSSANRSVELLFNSINTMNHLSHDIILTGDPNTHGNNATIAPDGSATHMEFFMAFFTDAVENLRPHVSSSLWGDWNTTLYTFNDSTYASPDYYNSSTGYINNWALVAGKVEKYRCNIGRTQSCSNLENISIKFVNQTNPNGYMNNSETNPVSAYGIFGGYWANEIMNDGYTNQSFTDAINKTINFTKSIQLQDGEWITAGRSSGHTWNLAQAMAFSFLQNGSDIGDWYRRADLAYSKIHQYEYKPDGTWNGAYYVVRNYYNPSLRIGYMNYSGWQTYNLLTGYFEARAGQLYNSSVTEQPISYSNFADFNSSAGSMDESGFLLLNNGSYSVYANPMYYPATSQSGYYNGTGVYPLRFIITYENAANVTIYPNPQDTTSSMPSLEKTNFDYFNSNAENIDVSSFNRSNITYGMGTNSLWVNWTGLRTTSGYSIGYWNLSAVVNGDIVTVNRTIGGLDPFYLTNYRQGIEFEYSDNRTIASKIITGTDLAFTRGNETVNITNVTSSVSGVTVANSAFDGYGQFGWHNRSLIYGDTTNADDYISYWKADGTGADVNTTSANTVTLSNGATYATGYYDQSFSFDGTDDIGTITSNSTLNFTNEFVFSAWLKPDTIGETAGRIYEKPNSYFAFIGDNVSGISFYWFTSSGACQFNASNGQTLENWNHYYVDYNNGNPLLEINGINTSLTWTSSNCGTINSTSNDLYIGNRFATDRSYDGLIDDIFLFNRELTPNEKTTLRTHSAIVSNNYDFQGTTLNEYGYQMTQLPTIQSYTPETPVSDTVGDSRTFTVEFTKIVNVTWYINGTSVQTNNSVTSATYTNVSAVLGNWTVNATGTNDYGSATQSWEWNVSQETTPPASITNISNITGDSSINWTWVNPLDVDFNYTMVYTDDVFQTNTSNPYYLLAFLNNSDTRTISTHTVDTSGNINTTWVNQTTTLGITAPSSIIRNGYFNEGQNNWTFYVDGGSGSWNIQGDSNYSQMYISNISSNMQLYQSHINLSNVTYYLNFSAKSNNQFYDMDVAIIKHTSPYTQYLPYTAVDLTTSWQDFSIEFTPENLPTYDENARLQFWFVGSAIDNTMYYIDNVTLTEKVISYPPAITSWSNTYTNNQTLNFTVNITDTINFNVTANQSITNWTWIRNDYEETNNFNNYTHQFLITNGTVNVSVLGTNGNGDTQSINWSIYVFDNGSYIAPVSPPSFVPYENETSGFSTTTEKTMDHLNWSDAHTHRWNESSGTNQYIRYYINSNQTTNASGTFNLTTNAMYNGNAAHYITVRIYNFTTSNFDTLTNATYRYNNAIVFDYRSWIGLSNSHYINSTNITIIEFNHSMAGNPTHKFYIDEVKITLDTTVDTPSNPAPAITSNLNNITSNSALDITVNVNNAILFSVGANQTISNWSWTGASQIGGNETTNSTASELFSSIGDTSVNVNGTNSNGTTSTLTWTIHVVADGGGGDNWDFLTGTINVSGATITTNPNVGSTTGGAYSFGYVFLDGNSYWINISKAGYTSNNTLLLFNEDHEILDINLTLISVNASPVISSWSNTNTSDADTSLTLESGTNITFNATSNQTMTSWSWTTATQINGTGSNESYASHNFTSSGTVSVTGTNGNGSTQTITWTITIPSEIPTSSDNNIYISKENEVMSINLSTNNIDYKIILMNKVTSQIRIVNDRIIFTTDNTLYNVNKTSGEIVAKYYFDRNVGIYDPTNNNITKVII